MSKKEIGYTESIAEIERILARLHNDEMTVDTLATEIARAAELIAGCREQLLKTEGEIRKIIES